MSRTPAHTNLLGVRVRVHYTCIVALLLVAVVVTTQFTESYGIIQQSAIGLATAIVYLFTVALRELVIQVAVNRRRGQASAIPVTLYPFGGVSETTDEVPLPNHELLLAAARWLASLVFTVIFYGLYAIFINADNLALAGVAEWLTLTWVTLFFVHILPCYPLDGGTVLRAFLLKRWGNFFRATWTVSVIGWGSGLFFVFAGVLAYIITRQWFVGLSISAAGWFLESAAGESRRRAALLAALEETTAAAVMTPEYTAIGDITIGQLFRDHILVSGWRCFIVTKGGTLLGVLDRGGVQSVPRKYWGRVRVSEVMTPAASLDAAYPAQTGASVLQQLDRLRLDDMPVVEHGSVVGVIARDRLTRLARTRSESGV